MSVESFSQHSTYDVARAEIESWRSECLDHFARGEAAIGSVLEAARVAGVRVTLYPLAPQRTMEAIRLADLLGTGAAAKDAIAAMSTWQTFESRRELLSFGVATETIDRDGGWYALFDMVSYRENRAARGRWAIGRAEAHAFLVELEQTTDLLRQRLGAIHRELIR